MQEDACESLDLLDLSQAPLEATEIDVWSAKYEAREHRADLLILYEKNVSSRQS